METGSLSTVSDSDSSSSPVVQTAQLVRDTGLNRTYNANSHSYYKFYNSMLSSSAPRPPIDAHLSSSFKPTVSLVPIKVTGAVTKVVASSPGLNVPEIRPYYMLVRQGKLSHAYSLVKDANNTAIADRPIAVRPVAEYVTPTRTWTHATVFDYSRASSLGAAGHNGGNGSYAAAVDIRVCFVRADAANGFGHLVFQADNERVYRWKRVECPVSSDNYVYLMHLVDGRGVVPTRPVPVAVVKVAPFRSPVDNSPLVAIDVDETNVAPHLAFLTFFAGTHTMFPTLLSSSASLVGLGPRAPKTLPRVLFGTQTLVNGANGYDDSDGDNNEGPKQDDNEVAEPIAVVKTLNSLRLSRYDMPPKMIHSLNTQARRSIKSQRMLLGIPTSRD